jgi:hypothetical protein
VPTLSAAFEAIAATSAGGAEGLAEVGRIGCWDSTKKNLPPKVSMLGPRTARIAALAITWTH